jgi:uncharacterized membrane protein (DUF485 family)
MDLTNHPLTALIAMLFLTEKLDVYPSWIVISTRLSTVFLGLSLLALLVMNFDRYLATSYPIFHQTSVTKGKLLTILAILVTMGLTIVVLISFNDCFYFPWSSCSNIYYNYLSSDVVHELQNVRDRQEKS